MHGTEERKAKRAYAESKLNKSTDRFGRKSNMGSDRFGGKSIKSN
jgi:hypothetical protein